jgi:pilus assembly protein CpaF
MLSPQVAAFLWACLRARLSIVFAGPPGSGKTTLLSCSTAELDPGLRVVVAEEVFESDVPVPNVAQMQTRAARPDRPEVDLRRLVAGFLRMVPDVAIVGDVRDREGLPELLSHVDMAAPGAGSPVQVPGAQTRHLGHGCSARPGPPRRALWDARRCDQV